MDFFFLVFFFVQYQLYEQHLRPHQHKTRRDKVTKSQNKTNKTAFGGIVDTHTHTQVRLRCDHNSYTHVFTRRWNKLDFIQSFVRECLYGVTSRRLRLQTLGWSQFLCVDYGNHPSEEKPSSAPYEGFRSFSPLGFAVKTRPDFQLKEGDFKVCRTLSLLCESNTRLDFI